MITGSLARRYARAILDIGTEKGTFEKMGDELDALSAMLSGSRDLSEALTNPVFPMSRRRAVLEAIIARMAVSPVTRNFLLLLLERERMPYLPSIARELRAMVDAKAGRLRAVVTSARPLSPEHEKNIRAALERTSGKKVLVEKRQDPELIGGVVTQVGDLVYDGSVRTQLEQMRERFLLD
jgi:F-type H+-transporting ATPase subunit delta